MAAGNGRSLGAALVDLWSSKSRTGGGRNSYQAKSWRSQFVQLTGTRDGYRALERAGVSATLDTQRSWLQGRTVARADTQARIADAYRAMQGGFDSTWETAKYDIQGRITMGSDSRVRTLRVDGRPGRWDRIRAEFDAGADPDKLEDLFIRDVIEEDIGEGSEPWTFNGGSYTVTT